jgi:hypothetical protein
VDVATSLIIAAREDRIATLPTPHELPQMAGLSSEQRRQAFHLAGQWTQQVSGYLPSI